MLHWEAKVCRKYLNTFWMFKWHRFCWKYFLIEKYAFGEVLRSWSSEIQQGHTSSSVVVVSNLRRLCRRPLLLWLMWAHPCPCIAQVSWDSRDWSVSPMCLPLTSFVITRPAHKNCSGAVFLFIKGEDFCLYQKCSLKISLNNICRDL